MSQGGKKSFEICFFPTFLAQVLWVKKEKKYPAPLVFFAVVKHLCLPTSKVSISKIKLCRDSELTHTVGATAAIKSSFPLSPLPFTGSVTTVES